jgi:crotonobetainyl-CoA:carnitine CoA-transferase CaiB-like acyl-CoA transferase
MNVLQGVTVLDVTAYAFVPSASGVLAHWGADVIKVESPRAPDPMRLMGGNLEPGRSSPMFRHYSRGKRSIAIDLATAEGQALVYRLAAKSDVFLTSYLAPTRKKLRIDVDDIRKANPNIIYARGSGQGPLGPDADRPGYDGLSWWYRGSLGQTAMDLTKDLWPTPMIGHGDGMSGMVLAGGICAALFHRLATGEAKLVDASLMGSAVWFNGNAILPSEWRPKDRTFGPVPRREMEGVPAMFSAATMEFYQTSDHRFIKLLFLGDDDRDFADLCERLGRPDLVQDPRFVGARARTENGRVLTAIFEAIFAQKSFAQWKEILADARGAWTPVQTADEVCEDPQTLANGFIQEVDYPDGPLKMPTPPVMFDEDCGEAARAPDFAEHTDEILRGLGCSAADIAAYREARVIA